MIYRGHHIERETSPWEIKYGNKWAYWVKGDDSKETLKHARSFAEAMGEIDERIAEKENKLTKRK